MIIYFFKWVYHYYKVHIHQQIKLYKSDYLTINGKNLNTASQEVDVQIKIGQSFCNVTSLSRAQVTCRPPQHQPEPLEGDHLPKVVVSISTNIVSYYYPNAFY